MATIDETAPSRPPRSDRALTRGLVIVASLFVLVVGAVAADTFVFYDECDPSENWRLAELSSDALDELCGVDRDFRFTHEGG